MLGVEKGHKVAGVTLQIVSESDLERFVRVGVEGDATLLNILGYSGTNVDDHPIRRVLIGTTQFAPDYVLRHQQKNLAVLDLKKPEEDLNNKNWVGQVLSYCQQIKPPAPLGLLFNGYALRVYINTHDRQLSKYHEWFSEEPVATAEHSDFEGMAGLLSKFYFKSLQANPIALTKKLANIEIGKRKPVMRQKQIRSILAKSLTTSPPGDIHEVLSALATVNSLWRDIDPPDTTEAELVSV